MTQKTLVFILSSRRSGSTWAGYVLGSHSRSAFLGEYDRAWQRERAVPCSWCAAKGNTHCSVLHGIQNVPEREAFDFAFSRIKKPILVDTSKVVHWAERFALSSLDIRFIHLIRDPRGYFFSERRRVPRQSWPALVSAWTQENMEISDFIRGAGRPYAIAFYDELASNPLAFEKLFRFLGLKSERAALNYWEKEHHGFAANGASSLMLNGLPKSGAVTGDDAFYSSIGLRNFYDRRWIENLLPEEKLAIEQNSQVTDFLAANGAFMNADGLRTELSGHRVRRWDSSVLSRSPFLKKLLN